MPYNVSPSVLGETICCETRGWVRHVKGFTSRDEAIKAVAGQAIHAGVETFLDPKPRDKAPLFAFHEIYDPAYARLAPELLEPALTPDNLHRLLARWIDMHPPHMVPWVRVVSVEKAVTSRSFYVADIENDTQHRVNLICRPDIVVEDKNGLYRWVDTKTTSWRISDKGWQRQLKLSMQVALYTDAMRTLYGDKAAMGGWINAMELRQLPSSDRKCKEHGLPYSECGSEHAKTDFVECMIDEERMQRAVADAEQGAGRFVTLHEIDNDSAHLLQMDGSAKDGCRFCPAAVWCEAGRHPASLDSLLVYEPWVVEEGQR